MDPQDPIAHLDALAANLDVLHEPAPAAAVLDPFHAALELNQAAAAFLAQLVAPLTPVVFPPVAQVQTLPANEQTFFAGVARVTRNQLSVNDYFMLPFNVAADAVFTFALLAAHAVWGLFHVLDVNNGSITCRYLGQVGGNVAHAGPLQLYQQISLLPPTHFLRPGMGYLAAFQHLIQAFQLANQPVPAAVLPPPAAAQDGGALVQALALLSGNNRAAITSPGATLADNFRQATLTAGMFDDQARFLAIYFPDLAEDTSPTANDLRHNYSVKEARLSLVGPLSLGSTAPDLTDKQLVGLMSFDFGDGHAGKVSIADIHPAGSSVTSPAHVHHALDILAGFARRFFGPSAAAGIHQLSFCVMAIFRTYRNLSVMDGVRLTNLQLQTVSRAFSPPPVRPLRDVYVDLLTINVENNTDIQFLLVSRVGLSTGASGSRPARSGGARLYPSAKSGGGASGTHGRGHGSGSGGRSTSFGNSSNTSTSALSPYEQWQLAKPPLGPGDEPCHAFITGKGPCANSAVCAGTGKKLLKHRHAFPPQRTQAQQAAFTAWIRTRPVTSSHKRG